MSVETKQNHHISDPPGLERVEHKWIWEREGDYILIQFVFLTCHIQPGGISIRRWICRTTQL